MTTPRLHLTRVNQAVSFDDQARGLFAAAAAKLPAVGDSSDEAIWNLAQYVDLVDAGYGPKDAVYKEAKARLAHYVRALWQQPGKRSLFGRSAALMAFVNEQLDAQAEAFEDGAVSSLAA